MFVFQSHFPSVSAQPGPAREATRKAGLGCVAALALAVAAPLAGAATDQPPQASPPKTQTADTQQWVPGRLLVQPRPGLSDDELAKTLKTHGAKSVGRIAGINVHIVQLPAQASEKAIAALLAKNPNIKFAEPDMILKPDATANDPYYGSAWHLPKIGAPAAWDTASGRAIIIAILDSGVDASHPDLAGKLVAGWNFYDNNSNTSDVYGHGTKVAGAAAAITNNSLGVAGVAGGATIMPIRVTATTGSAPISAMASGLTWAADRGARVANLSFQAAGYSTIQSAAQYLKNKGGLLTTAAGNSGTQQTFAYTDTLIVASATDANDAKTSWSSYGNFVSVAAPGAGIYSTVRGGGYAAVNGTSFAAPVTAGVVALMMATNPTLPASKIQSLLYASAVDLGSAGKDIYYGYGRINAAAAVLAAKSELAGDATKPAVTLTTPTGGSTVKGLVAVNVSASDNVGISRVDLMVNGSKLASDTTAPYSFSWDTSKVADGSATLTASAYDAAGNFASSSASIKVANATSTSTSTSTDATLPVVSISNPPNGATVSGRLLVAGSATDNVAVTSTKLFIDGRLVASTNGASLSFRWNSDQEAAGTHTIKAEARDAAGNLGIKTIQVTK